MALGFFWASWFTQCMPKKSPASQDVIYGLQQVLRRGLPVTSATGSLTELRGVVARAVDPTDAPSRTSALNGLLQSLLARFKDARYAEAVRALFGLPPALPGQNLTQRRSAAAVSAGHEVHHFRKRVEPRLIEQLAADLLADADGFTRTKAIAPRLTPAGARPRVPADPFAWEVAEEEEAVSRLWAAIYGLRAELVAIERLVSLGSEEAQIVPRAVTAAWMWGRASAAAVAHGQAYGRNDGQTPDVMLSLAGWTPPLPAPLATRLREAASTADSRREFLASVRGDVELGNAWIRPFLSTAIDEESR
ncbi:hypothetical protein [Phytomonospora endophytica]|uniref:Uncharacterized protein n=1 Tax=Phytomonospora endophytica TaxID=714109 RepID=A0A841G1Q8_9ACTN|nr:hypothetical protein [Phytomonospora endophytica]MBB6039858.1 hypothetical protein [Phytomonospora endophytica]